MIFTQKVQIRHWSFSFNNLSRKNITRLLYFCLVLKACSLYSQEELGYVNSKYAGINSIFINPTNLLNSRIFIDVNIAGADAFFHNNIVYMSKKEYSPLLGQIPEPSLNLKETAKRAYADIKIMGPSIGISYDNFSFGFFTRGRAMLDGKISKNLATLIVKDYKYDGFIGKTYTNEKMSLGTGAWTEFGANIGYMYKRQHYAFWNIGANLKYLTGISNSDIAIRDLDISIPDKDHANLINLKAGYRLTTPAWNAGRGFGIDVGWSYTKMLDPVSNYYPNNKKENGCKYIDYKYKIGFSIVDLGFIKYTRNSKVQTVEYTGGDLNLDSTKVNSVESFDQEIEKTTQGFKTKTKNHYSALIPLGFSAQYDYNFENNFYVNSTIIVGVRLPYQIKRADVLGLTLRYDRKYFGAAIPLSLYNWTYPQLGFSLRFGNNFIIGSDRTGFIFGKIRDTYGADIYVQLKFALFKHCKSGKKSNNINDCITKPDPQLENNTQDLK